MGSEVIAAVLLLCVAYPYTVYPLLLYAGAPRRAKNNGSAASREAVGVSVLLSVYNEEGVIEDKIKNFLALDYPKELLELIVVSDGSTDRTGQIVETYASEQVRLIAQHREGKTAALNKAAKAAKGGILVFTDANTFFREDAVQELVKPFSAPQVAVVTGRVVPVGEDRSEGLFAKFEVFLKSRESAWGYIAGADGAIYALRKELYTELDPSLINDFYHPIQAALAGARALFAEDAVAYEKSEDSLSREYARQKRMSSQAIAIIAAVLPEAIRKKEWLLLWVLFSHKVLRWLHVPLLIAFLGLLFVAGWHAFGLVAAAPLVLYVAVLAYCIRSVTEQSGSRGLLTKFMVVHWAYCRGLVDFITGRKTVLWEPRGGGVQ